VIRIGIFVLIIGQALCAVVSAMEYSEVMALKARVKQAIASGNVVPERDLAALIAAARSEKDVDNQKSLIEAIGDFGAADGDSPIAVKKYLLEQSTPFLIEVASKRGSDVFLRWDAMAALRSMNAPRAVLIQLADMCDQDPDDFIKSRGEILRNYAKSLPEKSETAAIKPTDAASEQKGIEFLKSRKLGVSLDQLRISALQGKADEVQALLDAGVDPNEGPVPDSPLNRALSGCSHAGGETAANVATVSVLIAGGANVKSKDENDNTPLLSAAQYCGAAIVDKLIAAGAEVNPVNKMGMTPLVLALVLTNVNAEDALISKGAKLTPEQAKMVSGNTDPRVKAIVQKALKK
jgi:Ankyrin repeats (3 copies)